MSKKVKNYGQGDQSWMVKIVKTDAGDKEKRITVFPYDDIKHALLDYDYECSIQAKYRGKISGITTVYLIEITSSSTKPEQHHELKSLELKG